MTPSELRRRIAAGEHVHDLETLADLREPQPGPSWLWLILLILAMLAALGLYRACLGNDALAREQVAPWRLALADYPSH